MKSFNMTVHGADKLAEKLDEIDSLVVRLRRKLAELNEGCLAIEMTLSNPTKSAAPGEEHIKR